VPCTFQATTGQVVLDQIRTVDKTRLVKRLRRIDADTAEKVVRKLQEMVAPEAFIAVCGQPSGGLRAFIPVGYSSISSTFTISNACVSITTTVPTGGSASVPRSNG